MNRYEWTDRKPGTPGPDVKGNNQNRPKVNREERRARDRNVSEGTTDAEQYIR